VAVKVPQVNIQKTNQPIQPRKETFFLPWAVYQKAFGDT